LKIRKMLVAGAKYIQIKAELKTSAGTISRVRLALENIGERPRSLDSQPPKSQIPTSSSTNRYSNYPRGPMAKYASLGWPVQLLATIFREVAEKRPPPKK
jgi:hypothetical protein